MMKFNHSLNPPRHALLSKREGTCSASGKWPDSYPGTCDTKWIPTSSRRAHTSTVVHKVNRVCVKTCTLQVVWGYLKSLHTFFEVYPKCAHIFWGLSKRVHTFVEVLRQVCAV